MGNHRVCDGGVVKHADKHSLEVDQIRVHGGANSVGEGEGREERKEKERGGKRERRRRGEEKRMEKKREVQREERKEYSTDFVPSTVQLYHEDF